MREQITETKMHALDYWQVIRNRWGVILLTFFLITLASLVIIALLDKKFAGRSKFQVMQSSAPGIYGDNARDEIFSRGNNWLETQFKILTARTNLLKVVENMSLTTTWGVGPDEAAARLERMIETEQERGTEIMSVTVWSGKGDEAALLANELVKAYEQSRTEIEKDRVRRRQEALQAQTTLKETAVDKARQEMLDIMKRNGIVDTAGNSNGTTTTVTTPALQLLTEAMKTRSDTELNVRNLKIQMESLMRLEGIQLIQNAVTLGVQDATITRVFPEYQTARNSYESNSRSGLGRRHPSMMALEASISGMYKQLLDAVESYKGTLKVKLDQAEATLAEANKVVTEKEQAALEDKQKQNEYVTAKQKWESALTQLNSMKDYHDKTMADDSVVKKPIHILEEAKADVNPSKPNVMLLLSIGSLLGLVLGLLLAFFLEYLDTSVKSLDDVERYLGVPVLAVIPKDVGVLHKQSGLSPDAEAYRILRTNIEFNRRSADANAITIVSGGAGEGKSTTLVNLAYICAQGGYNTLMIDGDLRRPKLHTFFDINNSVGLTNYLTTALMLEDVILQTPIENLYFMPSGILPADAAGILNSRRMSELIADVKNRFDLVLIDSPPILGVSDASVLASEVDLTIIVIQHRKLPRNMLLRVKQAIENVGGNLLGVVLNNVDVRSDSQYQYYTSYYTYYSPTNVDTKSKPRPSAQGGNQPQPSARPAAAPAGKGADKDDY
jgi:polysaccharide biosynthesis transport protein